MRDARVLVVGAGETGLQLAAHVRHNGGQATLLTDTPPDRVAAQPVRSTQVKVGLARRHEATLGLDVWPEAPQITGLLFQLVQGGQVAMGWQGALAEPAVSVNQPDRFAIWLAMLADRGVDIRVGPMTVAEVDRLAAAHDLVVVTGAPRDSDLHELFAPDPAFPSAPPARRIAVSYYDGVEPLPGNVVQLALLPGLAEILLIPAYQGDPAGGDWRSCHIVMIEAVPGGPLDSFADRTDPEDRARHVLDLLRERAPCLSERCGRARLTDRRGTLVGAVRPVVRRPVGHLPGTHRPVLCGGDIAVLNDPLGASGANNGSQFAAICARRIAEHDGPFDGEWMRCCSEEWRTRFAYPSRTFTETLLNPTDDMLGLLAAAVHSPDVAQRIVGLFEDPGTGLAAMAAAAAG